MEHYKVHIPHHRGPMVFLTMRGLTSISKILTLPSSQPTANSDMVYVMSNEVIATARDSPRVDIS